MTSVALIIPCFDDGRFLPEALASARAQTHPDTRVIVVDDGSTDPETLRQLDVARNDGVTVLRQDNAGPSAARNLAISSTDAEYVLPHDVDDRIDPTYAAKAAAVLDSRREVGLVYCQADVFGARTGPWLRAPWSLKDMTGGNVIPAATMFRRSDWDRVGGYHDVRLDDHDLWLSILELGRDVVMLDEVLYHYRVREGSITDTMSEQDSVRALAEVIRRHPRFYDEHLELLIELRREQWRTLQHWKGRYGRVEDAIHRVAPTIHRVRRRLARG